MKTNKHISLSELKQIRRDFQDARVPREDLKLYIREETRNRISKNYLICAGFSGAILGGTTVMLGGAFTSLQYRDPNIIIGSIGICFMSVFAGAKLAADGYWNFSPLRQGHYKEVQETAETNRKLSERTLDDAISLYSMEYPNSEFNDLSNFPSARNTELNLGYRK